MGISRQRGKHPAAEQREEEGYVFHSRSHSYPTSTARRNSVECIPCKIARGSSLLTKQSITIVNKLGLHARAAAKFVTLASTFPCDVHVIRGTRSVNGKSIMAVMLLAAAKGTELQIETRGEQEQDAMKALVTLINNRFGEAE